MATWTSGDGCASDCQEVEANFACPGPGASCVQIVVCGNARIEGGETCDDRNTASGDGCDSSCHVEAGWQCPSAGTACMAASCGDGIVAGFEACDDMGSASPGCDDNCQLESGYHCPDDGEACQETTCGDGMVQGNEECEDGNLEVGDGCDPFCRIEPSCANGTCNAVCGDEVRWDPEECDDGNTVNGDGCDSSCRIETGFVCQEVPLPDPPEVSLPVTYRDFINACGAGARPTDADNGAIAPYGHPDFDCYSGTVDGMVEDVLDADGKPVRVDNAVTTSDADFALWYRTNHDYNRTYAQSLTLPSVGGGAYQFDDSSFFPLTGTGFPEEDCMGSPCEQLQTNLNDNFFFTSEVRYWFEYNGSEVLTFSGDDDVWVFINNRLAVDIGGVHGRITESVNLGDAAVASELGLSIGGVYEAVVFQAERHVTQSQYQLTLTNFNRAPSECMDFCGDGVASSQEVCDTGADNGDGDGSKYGGCSSSCTFEPYCGDGNVDEDFGEICDDGLNLGGSASECSPGCKTVGSFCGDGVVQTSSGEQCDDGNAASGDGCSAECDIEIE